MSETTVEQTPAPSCCGPAVEKKPGVVGFVKNIVTRHTAWMVLGLAFLAVAVFDTAQVPTTISFTLQNLLYISPFLAAAVGFAGVAKATGADGQIARVFSGQLALMIVVAALFGALSPFCSCGVIPIIAALLSMGVPLPAVMAFWISSPLMDPAMFALTTGTLGLEFAIAKTVAAISIGLIGGYVTWGVSSAGLLANPLRPEVGDGGCGASSARNAKQIVWNFWHDPARVDAFRSNALSNLMFLGKWLTIAFFLESIMLAYVPAEAVASLLGSGSDWAIPLAAIVGVPAYMNGYAALPLVSGMTDLGVSPGAGMAFLIAGGMTSVPAAIAVFALVKKPVFGLYVLLALVGGILSGVGYQIVV